MVTVTDHEAADDVVDAVEAAWQRERPDIDVSSVGVISRLWRIARHLERERREQLAEHGVDGGTVDVLAELRRGGAPYRKTAGELQAKTLVSSGGLSQRLQRMEDAGLIRRSISKADRRVVDVCLTEAGIALIDEVTADLMRHDSAIIACLTSDQIASLRLSLRKLLSHLES